MCKESANFTKQASVQVLYFEVSFQIAILADGDDTDIQFLHAGKQNSHSMGGDVSTVGLHGRKGKSFFHRHGG